MEVLLERGFAIMNGKEDPVLYFTKTDYHASVQPASYGVKTSEAKNLPSKKPGKKVAKKKTKTKINSYAGEHKTKENTKKVTKKKTKTKSGGYAREDKAKGNTKVEAKGSDGDKG